MAKGFGGFGGGMANMQNLMKQAQKMQEDMARIKQEIAEAEVEGSAGGGMVKVIMTGDKVCQSVSINPDAVDKDDIEMLEDLIVAALKDASLNADKLSDDRLGQFKGLI